MQPSAPAPYVEDAEENVSERTRSEEGVSEQAAATGRCVSILEAPPGFEPGMEVLQTSALPLGDGADRKA